MVEVKIKNIGLDSITGSPILMLADINNEEYIYPIWIGISEAEGIILKQAGIKTPRPLTYDLFKNTIEKLGAKVKKVAIVDYKDNAYIAEIILEKEKEEIIIDSRPSDAINLALRFNAPIFLNENVVKKVNLKEIKEAIARQQPPAKKEEYMKIVKDLEKTTTDEIDKELEEFRKMLDKITPEDFAKIDFKKKEN